MDALSPLSSMALADLVDRLASRQPVPGGGTAAALAGALAAALVEMVAALTHARDERGQAEQEQDLISEVSDAATSRRRELLDLAQADADAYAAVVAARRLPRDGEPAGERSQRIGAATRQATLVPLRTAEAAAAVLELSARIAPVGNRNAVSDVGVAAQLASASVRAAVLNVRINLPGLPADDGVRRDAAARAEELWGSVVRREADVVALVTRRMATAT